MYTVVGYDKDNDVYISYVNYDIKIQAVYKAFELKEKIRRGELKRKDTGEPIDWIEIYQNYGNVNESLVGVF